MKLKLLKSSLLAALIMASGLTAQATDQALLDLLVKNGYVTQAQAAALAKEADSVDFSVKSKKVDKVQLTGRLHIQYDNISVDDDTDAASDHPSAVNSFILRRIYLGAKVSFYEDWSGTIIARFNDNSSDLDKALITKTHDNGKFDFGYRKVNFGFEENTSSSKIKAVERSLVSRYFNERANPRRVGIGGRHIGVYAEGNHNGLGYGLAITNGRGEGDDIDSTPDADDTNELGFYANAHYTAKMDEMSLKAGLNLGYQPEGNTPFAEDDGVTEKSDIFAYNPYAELKWGHFRLVGEFLGASIDNGAQGSGDDADPWGINIMPSFKINDQWELVFRYSHLDGDDRGIRVSDGIRRANNPDGDPAYNEADAFYFGFNWYIKGNDLKLSAGYEYADFSDRLNGSGVEDPNGEDAEAHAFRARLQMLF